MNIGVISGVFFALAFFVAFGAAAAGALFLRMTGHELDPQGSGATLLRNEAVSSISPWARILERLDMAKTIAERTREAGFDWSAGRVTAMMLLSGALGFTLLSGITFVPKPVLVLASIAAAALPFRYILHVRKTRFQHFTSAFPDAVESLCRALRAGQPFAAGVEMIAADGLPPVSVEFRRMLDEWRLGASWNQALDNLSARVPVTECGIFAAAVKQQMKTGGRLGDVLSKLAETMRESVAIQGEVRSMAAHGKLSGNILTLLPVAIAFVIYCVNPDQMLLLVEHPAGRLMIWIAVALLILAHFVIRKIVDVRY